MMLSGEVWDKHALGSDFQFGTDKWHAYYSSLRQSVESANRKVKDGASAALASPDRRSIRGFAAAFFLSTLLLMHINLKTVARWDDPELDSQGRPTLRKIETGRREETNGKERPGLLRGEQEPPDIDAIPYTKVK